MQRSRSIAFTTIATAFWLATTSVSVFGQEVSPEHAEQMKAGLAIFRSDVKEILTSNCLECHNERSRKGDFDISSRSKLMESGFIDDGSPDSHLLQLVRHEMEPFMPHELPKLSESKIARLQEWIALGAPYSAPLTEFDITSKQPMQISDQDRDFWSFRKLRPISAPDVRNVEWAKTEIDNFILQRLEDAGIGPNGSADRQTLIRRVYFDLIGLPPTPGEIEKFVSADSPDAYSQLIDRLLNSRRYGERWARHWLDVARFAESSGFEHDDDRPNAYHYRDFVIKALNADMPFDQFVRWQIAGDQLQPNDPLALSATGFLGAGTFPTQLTEAEFESARYDEIDDMVTTTGVAFLGLSIGCARCHDHKFDPIPTADYYRIAAAFAKTVRAEIDITLEPATTAVQVQITGDGFAPMKNHADGRGYPYFYENVHELRRGDVTQKGEVAVPGVLQVLLKSSDLDSADRDAAGTTDLAHARVRLAHWITDPVDGAGHLAARVIVNRIWQHHFGEGLVATPNDFGKQGSLPTHPELLDWLAIELINNDWSVKHIHKLIMTSSVYMQSDHFDEQRAAIDPDNRLHWRHAPRRLEAEAIRDAMLAVSGTLDDTMFGPGSLDESSTRRSIYFTVKRSKLIPSMMLFDWPEHLVSIGKRAVTTTAPQALLFMNNQQTRTHAQAMANRIAPRIGKGNNKVADVAPALQYAYQLAFGRSATEQELASARDFVTEQSRQSNDGDATVSALSDFCQMLLSSNEFVFVR
ncbi:MAG: DUF1549 domain-containing protein [Planctomycetales bacterium]|nr:DUF1549 domain-containing protein [Planctomycetales bacterium]